MTVVAETGRIVGGAILLLRSGPAGRPGAVAAEAERIVRKSDLAQLPRKLRFDFATLRFRFPHFAGNPGENSAGGRDQRYSRYKVPPDPLREEQWLSKHP
jgi:hypothetical protein